MIEIYASILAHIPLFAINIIIIIIIILVYLLESAPTSHSEESSQEHQSVVFRSALDRYTTAVTLAEERSGEESVGNKHCLTG